MYQSDGSILEGWPVCLERRFNSHSSPTLGDLEIIVGSVMGWEVYAWHHDGTFLPGWPLDAGAFGVVNTSPVVEDLDGDGNLEVVAASYSQLNVWDLSSKSSIHDDEVYFPLDWPMFPQNSGNPGRLGG